MTSKNGFEFPIDESGQWDGFNDPGIEHFTGNRLQHLGREVPQNTIDAKIASPAQIAIFLKKVSTDSIPGVDELRLAIERCKSAADKEDHDKAKKFFSEAARLLTTKQISVLQIADRNTTGVKGPCQNGTPYFALMKATGQSKKSDTSTGSYGIGKFAPFAVSELRTVFLTTVWEDEGGQTHHYLQGKSVLTSHYDEAGRTRRGTGFWGVREKCQPVTSLKEAPEWLQLNELVSSKLKPGTMLSILGFHVTKDWKQALAANIVENFFGSIKRGELEVFIADNLMISKDTLADILSNAAIRDSVADQVGEPEKYLNVASYLRAMEQGGEVIVRTTQQQHLGECELRILLGENLPKKVAVLRNGMLITESLPGIKRFSDYKDFVAVLQCLNSKGQSLLRAMEPPRHDAFEPDRLPSENRAQGRTALRELASFVRKALAEVAKDPVSEETNLDELADFFGDDEELGLGKKKDDNLSGDIIIRAKPLPEKKSREIASASEEEDFSSEGQPQDDNAEGGLQEVTKPNSSDDVKPAEDGGGTTRGESAKPKKAPLASTHKTTPTSVFLANIRAVPTSLDTRKVTFTAAISGNVILSFEDSGADSNYPLRVKSTSSGFVEMGKIHDYKVIAGVRSALIVTFEEEFDGTLRIVANAV